MASTSRPTSNRTAGIRIVGLLTTALVPAAAFLAPQAAWAACLPGAGSSVLCQAADADGFADAREGLAVDITDDAVVNSTGANAGISIGRTGIINNRGRIDTSATTGPAVVVSSNATIRNADPSVAFPNSGAIVGNATGGAIVIGGAASTTAVPNINTILNSGTITGFITTGDGNTTLTNAPTAVVTNNPAGGPAIITGAITMGAGNDTLSNSGTITGAIAMGAGVNVLTNAATGTIIGAISSTGNTTLTNAGAITGNITTGAGDDTITTTGTITGNIAMGAGINTIGFGSTAALPTGTLSADAAGTNTVNLFGSGADSLNIAVTNFDVLNKDGTGSWALTQTVALADRINVNAGTLSTPDADFLGANLIVNNAAVAFTGTADGTYAGAMSGSGTVTVSGTAITTVSGANTYTGLTTVNGGTLRVTGGAAIVDTGTVTVNVGGTFDVAASETIAALTGAGAVTIGAGSVLSTGSVTSTFSGAVSGAGGLTKIGGGALTLSGTNTFTGAATATNGNLILTGGSALGDTTSLVITSTAASGNIPAFAGTVTVDGAETFGALGGNGGSLVVNAAVSIGGLNIDTAFNGVISGAGALTKTGTGTLTLSGANTNTGGWTVSGGTLGGSTTSLVGNFTVNVGGTLLFNQATNGTFAGTYTGGGIFSQTGAATITYSGNNAGFTGAVNILGGVYSINVATNLGAGTVTINGASLQTTAAMTLANAFVVGANGATFDLGGNTSLTGVISGTGALTKTGGGTLTLAGANTYSGGTTIVTGGLTGTTTSIQGNVASSGTVTFDQAAAGTYAGNLSGTGALVKTGTGAVTFTGTNTFSGTTSITGGTLIVGTTGIGDLSAVTIGTGATLQLAGNETIGSLAGDGTFTGGAFTLTTGGNGTSTSFGGAATGAGLTKTGAGVFTLTGASTFTAAVTVSGGGLTVATGGALTAASLAATGGTTTIAGTLTAPVAVSSGATLLVAAGGVSNGDVAGAAGSTVQINGTVNGNVANAGAGSGTGTINGVVTNSGTLAPGGAAVGRLTINAPSGGGGGGGGMGGSGLGPNAVAPGATIGYTQTSTGTLTAQISPGAAPVAGTGYDQLVVNGGAALGGTLAVTAAPGLYVAGTTYDLVVASQGINGNFASVTGNVISPFLSFTPTITAATGTGATPNQQIYRWTATRTNYATVGQTPNQIAVANGFQAAVAGATGDMSTVIVGLDNMSAAQAQSFFDQSSPEFYGSMITAIQDSADLFYRQIGGRVMSARGGEPMPGGWISAYGQWGNGDNKTFRFASDIDVTGVAAGFDFVGGAGFRAGLAVGFSKSDVEYDLNAEGDADSKHAAAYASYNAAALSVDATIGYFDYNIDAERAIASGTISRATTAEADGDAFKAALQIGFDVGGEAAMFRPFIGLDYAKSKVGAFSETGASALDLVVSKQSVSSTKGSIGVEFAGAFGSGDTALKPFARAAYRHDFSDNDRAVTARFAGSPASTFSVLGVDPNKSSFDIDAGLSVGFGANASAFVGYQGTIRSDATRHGVSGGFRLSF